VRDAKVRLREAGHVISGEALVVPVDERALPERVEAASEALRELDWMLHDVIVSPVASLEDDPHERHADTAKAT
jgi:hypothetical protein